MDLLFISQNSIVLHFVITGEEDFSFDQGKTGVICNRFWF